MKKIENIIMRLGTTIAIIEADGRKVTVSLMGKMREFKKLTHAIGYLESRGFVYEEVREYNKK